MKHIKKFESSKWKIDLTDEEIELKENLEFILLDLNDTSSDYEVSGRNIYMGTEQPLMSKNSTWYRNTGVEFGFTEYLNIRISPNYKEIDEVIKILKECINYVKSQGWEMSATIERGMTISRIDIEYILELSKLNKNLGSISIFLWKM